MAATHCWKTRLWATVKSPIMDVAENGFEPKEVKVLMAMGEVLYGFTDFGLERKSVKVAAEREKRRPVITESGFEPKSVMEV